MKIFPFFSFYDWKIRLRYLLSSNVFYVLKIKNNEPENGYQPSKII